MSQNFFTQPKIAILLKFMKYIENINRIGENLVNRVVIYPKKTKNRNIYEEYHINLIYWYTIYNSDLFVPIQILIAQACWNVDCWQPKLILIAGIWSDTGCLLLLLGAGIIIPIIYQKYVKIIHFCTKRFSAIYLRIFLLSSSGPGPGQVKVRWGSGKGQEGQSQFKSSSKN